jgi:hypothetical protein
VDVDGRLQPAGSRLPDEPARDPSELSWGPGALDGAFGHAGDDVSDEERGARVADVVRWACQRPSARRRQVLYEQVREDSVLEIADPLTQRLAEHPPDRGALHELGCWLATTAPDRGAVKVGLVLLGVAGVGEALQVVRVLGAHEELTLYAAVAVGNGTDDPEAELWAMARKVEGWGRIHCVERLQHTTDPAIRDWILRTGFRNSVMDDYLALIAARTGGLLPALRGPTSTGSCSPQPGTSCWRCCRTAGRRHRRLRGRRRGGRGLPGGDADAGDGPRDLTAVTALQEWLASDTWSERPGGALLQRELCLAACREITARDHWQDWISVALLSEDEQEFGQAQHLAVTRGLDTFDALLHGSRRTPSKGPGTPPGGRPTGPAPSACASSRAPCSRWS